MGRNHWEHTEDKKQNGKEKLHLLFHSIYFSLNQEETKIKTSYIKYIENLIGGGYTEVQTIYHVKV